MPYINDNRREALDPKIDRLSAEIVTRGDLNYTITKLCLKALHSRTYEAYESVLGTLESVKLEFYRRVTVPYEDAKCKDNGEVYK